MSEGALMLRGPVSFSTYTTSEPSMTPSCTISCVASSRSTSVAGCLPQPASDRDSLAEFEQVQAESVAVVAAI